ncbi:MAG: 4'-phosphopantetheinyl transferase superfamily protein [Terracidiphilus sp.]|jgi:4'-phosphopantetheinyl transferase
MTERVSPRKLPTPATIEVWTIDLDEPLNQRTNLDDILSADERGRAGRFHSARDASRFRVCRTMLRLGLARYLETTPGKIAFATNRHGKPYIAECPALHFNVSHSGGLGAIAFSNAGEVGIDVEATDRDIEALEIATANFTKREAAMVAAAETAQEQARIFLRLWTRKEAILKAAGSGLLGGLEGVDVSHGPLDRVRCATDASADFAWRIEDLRLADGFAGAVSAPAGDWSIEQSSVSFREALGASRLVVK